MVDFSLDRLLVLGERASVWPTSVRLSDTATRILVQSNDEKALQRTLNELGDEKIGGDKIGITMRTDGCQATVSSQSSVIFTDSTSSAGVLGFMRLIVEADAVLATATA
jgi:hypothetical protein